MKSRCVSLVAARATGVGSRVALGCIASLFILGSAALGQPYPSFPLDTAKIIGPSVLDAYRTRVAYGDPASLVIWNDGARMLGSRLDLNGDVIDTLPLYISGPGYSVREDGRPDVAWSGQNFLVAWVGAPTVAAALVQPDGQVVRRITLVDSGSSRQGAAVAFDGANFLVAWVEQIDTFAEARFTRVTTQGVVLDSPPRRIPPALVWENRIDVAYGDGRYLATWVDAGIVGNFIMPDGTVPDTVGLAIHAGDEPAVTHDGRNFIVAWEWGEDVMAARVTADGTVLDTAGVLVANGLVEEHFDVAALRGITVVGWTSYTDDYDSTVAKVRRLDSELGILDSTAIRLMPSIYNDWGYADYAAVAPGPGEFLAVWCQPTPIDTEYSDNMNAYFRRVRRNGTLPETTAALVSYGTNSQTPPDVASDGTDFLGVWTDIRYESGRPVTTVRGSRFTPAGAVIGPAGFPVSHNGGTRPAVAFGADCYFCCWTEAGDVFGARVTADGQLIDTIPIELPRRHPLESSRYPDVAFGDSVFLVTWLGTFDDAVYGRRVTPTGVSLDSVPILLQVQQTGDSRYHKVAFDGENFLVVRNDNDAHLFLAVRVSPAGRVLDSVDIAVGRAASGSAVPHTAFGGGIYCVVDGRFGATWRVSPSGVVLESVPHVALSYPQVGFDGTNFVLVDQGDSAHQLTAMRMTPEGGVLDSIPFLLVTTETLPVSSRYAAMAGNDLNQLGLTFRTYEPRSYSNRVYASVAPPIVGIRSGRPDTRFGNLQVLPSVATGRVTLSFALGSTGTVVVDAFDITGRRAAVLLNGPMQAGPHNLALDTRGLARGVYFLRLAADGRTSTIRLVVAK